MGKVTITDEAGAASTPADGVTLYPLLGVLYYIDDGGTVHEIVTDNNIPLTDSITTAMLKDDAVTADKLANNAVDTAAIADDAVTAAKIADNVVGATYNAGTDLTLEVVSDRIGAAASASGSIATSIDTDGTLKAGAVDVAAVLATGVVETAKIADDAVTLAKLQNITRGSIIVGGAADAPTLLDANDSGKILVGDGTDLKSVAVSGDVTLSAAGAVTIANSAITAAKISPAALAQPGIVFDPFNLYIDPSADWGDGRSHWYQSACVLSIEAAPGTDNPWAGPNLKLGSASVSAQGGKILYPDDLALREGDTLNFVALMSTAASQYYLWARCQDSGNNWIGTFYYTSATGDGTLQTLTLTGVTIPASTARLVVGAMRVAGSDDIYIAAMWGHRGALACSAPAPTVDPWLASEIVIARGSHDRLDERLDVSLNADGTLKSSSGRLLDIDHWGRYNLHSWQAQIAKINGADGSSQAILGIIGDSWVHNVRLHLPLSTWLEGAYGDAGAGFGHAGDPINLSSAQPAGITRATTGTWTLYDEYNGADVRGVNLGHAASTDEGTPASIAWTASAHAFVLHYIKMPNGGSFRYRVDSGSWTTITTANATEIFASVTVSGLDGSSHTLTVEVVAASVAGIKILGCDCQKTGNGVRTHDLGNDGSTTSDWVGVDATIWEAGLAALAPHTVAIILGVNDRVSNVPPSTYYNNLATLCARITAALPLADILLIAPADISGGTYTYTAAEYADQMYALAVANNYAFFDLRLNIPSYANGNSRGLYADTKHLAAAGGQLLTNALIKSLLAVK